MGQFNEVRLHSALGYVTPATKLAGREEELFALRDAKLEAARQRRQQLRAETVRHAQQERNQSKCYTEKAWPEDRALLGSNPSAESGPETKIEAAHALPPSSSFLEECIKSQGVRGTASPD